MAQLEPVLIVDDHPQTVRACRAALRGVGLDVLSAATLHEALETGARMSPRALLVDAALLGQGDGPGFLRQTRTLLGSRNDLIVLLVPPRYPGGELDVLRPFADEVVFKPFSVDDLVEIVRRKAILPLAYESEETGHGMQAAAESPTPWEFETGDAIGGCRIEKMLGRGSSGAVFLGHHEVLGVPVAVKIMMLPTGPGSDEDWRRFLRGAKAAAGVQHPNVVQVLNAGREGGRCFLVHRYVPGRSLKEVMLSAGKMHESALLRILSDIAAALAAVHERGIVHRDVKPANIIIEVSGRAILCDFGLARPRGKGEVSGGSEVVGTPYYMSPEQCRVRALDERSDLYSLGVTAYHALSGCLPIQGETPLEVLRRHVEQEPRPLSELVSPVSGRVSKLVMRLLAKDRDKRFQSAGELLAALRRVRT